MLYSGRWGSAYFWVNAVLTYVSPEESAEQKVATEDLFLLTKNILGTVLYDFCGCCMLSRQRIFNKDRLVLDSVCRETGL